MRIQLALCMIVFSAACPAAEPESLAHTGDPVPQVTPASEGAAQVTTKSLSLLLKPEPVDSPHIPGFYEEIPESLDAAVRYIGEENYSSATAALNEQMSKAKNAPEKARVLMWMGISAGQHALDDPSVGSFLGSLGL